VNAASDYTRRVEHADEREPLVLASGSPRRRELLARVGVAVEVMPPDVDESRRPEGAPLPYVRRVARSKAAAVARRLPDRWVLAADTIVEVDGEILGKPSDAADARRMWELMAGRSHQVITVFALRGPGSREVVREVATEVIFRAASPDEIAAYLRAGEWRDKAGGYAAQGMAAAFVSGVRGSFTNVVGLPLVEVLEELARVGAAGPDYERGVPA
jgi:septum formation protein